MNQACAFCAIVRGDTAVHRVLDEPDTLAFLDRAPLFKGHTLVLPRAHVATLDDCDRPTLAALFGASQRISRALQKALAADGSFVAVNTRVSQSVPHVHVHVVPRHEGDGLFSPRPIWRRGRYASEADAAATAERIRAALA